MDAQAKLELLADAGRFDLACACATKNPAEHRKRTPDGQRWLYPVSLPSGGSGIMLKTLLSSSCVGDCAYCPLRTGVDRFQRCTLGTDEIARLFLDYDRKKRLLGLFLSSGVIRDPDHTMARLNAVAVRLRKKYAYRGYIHLKVIPGASDEAIREAVRYASAVSVNIEVPAAKYCERLSARKDWERDIVRPMRLIQKYAAELPSRRRVRQTTQFVVGAAGESDQEIVASTFGLYKKLGLQRVYYSAYQSDHGHASFANDASDAGNASGADRLTREHRLYQTDFLIRRYGFAEGDMAFGEDGNLSLTTDPKKTWADGHPEFFPVRVRNADRWQLLRVPGLGPITVERILTARRETVLRGVSDLRLPPKRATLAGAYLSFD